MKIVSFLCDGERYNCRIVAAPCFTWQIKGAESQSSFCLKVFEGRSVIYDSGDVISSAKISVTEISLKAETEYVAVLSVTASHGETATAKCKFHSALTEGFDKRAKWISAPEIKLGIGGNPAAYFKKEFCIAEVPKHAFAYVAGLGLYDISVNGYTVDKEVLKQPFTNYSKKIFYGVHNVADYLKEGVNTVEIVLADGWYNQNAKDTWKFWQAEWKDINKFIFQIDVGEKIFSDGTWKVCTDGIIVRSALRLGEIHDFRRIPSYKDFAVMAQAPQGRVTPRIGNPIKETEKLLPKNVKKTEDGFLYDFGRNIIKHFYHQIARKDTESFRNRKNII